MIKINQIEEKHPFPVIDFKFQNTGKGTAFLREFVINIKSIKIDLTPALKFRYAVEDNEFRILARNDGYGPANNSKIMISEESLNKLLGVNTFQFDIEAGQEKEIVRIGKTSLKRDLLKGKTKLQQITIDWACEPEDGRVLNKSEHLNCSYAYSMNHSSIVYIDKNGFSEEISYDDVSFSLRGPSEIYCVILDSALVALQRQYPVSREIASGDIDRFHIMVGADKSVKAELSFSFKIDQNTIVNSDLFEINIWKPLNQNIYDYYLDGDIIKAQLDEKVVNINKDDCSNYEIERLRHQFDRIKTDSNYPFLKESNKDMYW